MSPIRNTALKEGTTVGPVGGFRVTKIAGSGSLVIGTDLRIRTGMKMSRIRNTARKEGTTVGPVGGFRVPGYHF
jgi:hypothetical protein